MLNSIHTVTIVEPEPQVIEPEAEPQVIEPEAEPQVTEPEAEPQVIEPEAEPQVTEPEAESDITKSDIGIGAVSQVIPEWFDLESDSDVVDPQLIQTWLRSQLIQMW